MNPQDCTWCGSAQSIEYGICQVCLMRMPDDSSPDPVVIELAEPVVLPEPVEVEHPAVESAAE